VRTQADKVANDVAWRGRRNAAAPYLGGFGAGPDSVCPKAGQIASQTDSVQAAINAALKASGNIPAYRVRCAAAGDKPHSTTASAPTWRARSLHPHPHHTRGAQAGPLVDE